jgi:hypothetical protein
MIAHDDRNRQHPDQGAGGFVVNDLRVDFSPRRRNHNLLLRHGYARQAERQ